MKRFLFGICIVIAAALFVSGGAHAQIVAKSGESCGGFTGAVCGKNQWCEPKVDLCGISLIGVCVPSGVFCTQVYKPQCGCDGRTYGNECMRRNAKVSKLHDGPCLGDAGKKR